MKVCLVVYDNGSHMLFFPQGLAAIAAVIRNEGHEVTIWDQDVHHYPSHKLTQFLDENHFDVIGISLIAGYWQYKKLLELSEAIAASKDRPKYYVLGGYGPAPEPEYFLRKTNADIVVIGEGEDTTKELLRVIEDAQSLSTVNGIAFREGEDIQITPERELIPEEFLDDPDRIPMPAYDLFDMNVYRLQRSPSCTASDFVQPIMSGRGCPFKCNFCYRMDKGHRVRSVSAMLEEIDYLMTEYDINYFLFSDDLLMTSKGRTMEIAESFLEWQEVNKKQFVWGCNGRLNYAKLDVLQAMERSGCVFINYGIEAFDNQTLRTMKKVLTEKMIETGVQETYKTSINPGLNFIWGNLGETRETLQAAVDFLIKYSDHTQFRTIKPVAPYPGSPLYYEAIIMGLLDKNNPAEDFYEKKHLNSELLTCNFTNLSDDECYEALADANKQLVDNYFGYQTRQHHMKVDELYFERNSSFRGFRWSADASNKRNYDEETGNGPVGSFTLIEDTGSLEPSVEANGDGSPSPPIEEIQVVGTPVILGPEELV